MSQCGVICISWSHMDKVCSCQSWAGAGSSPECPQLWSITRNSPPCLAFPLQDDPARTLPAMSNQCQIICWWTWPKLSHLHFPKRDFGFPAHFYTCREGAASWPAWVIGSGVIAWLIWFFFLFWSEISYWKWAEKSSTEAPGDIINTRFALHWARDPTC